MMISDPTLTLSLSVAFFYFPVQLLWFLSLSSYFLFSIKSQLKIELSPYNIMSLGPYGVNSLWLVGL